MGLDMYLLGKNSATGETDDLGYWRKANAVHGWFVRECADGLDECQEIRVSRDQLRQLRADCNNALATRNQAVPTQHREPISITDGNAGEIILAEWERQQQLIGTTLESDDPLAPTAGFFFGSTDKDEYYYADLLSTIDIIDNALQLSDEWEVIYQASW